MVEFQPISELYGISQQIHRLSRRDGIEPPSPFSLGAFKVFEGAAKVMSAGVVYGFDEKGCRLAGMWGAIADGVARDAEAGGCGIRPKTPTEMPNCDGCRIGFGADVARWTAIGPVGF